MSVMQWTHGLLCKEENRLSCETGLERIAAKARPVSRRCVLLHWRIMSLRGQQTVWGNLCGMSSKTAPGVDGQTVEEAQEP